jgi:deoxyribonuclease V
LEPQQNLVWPTSVSEAHEMQKDMAAAVDLFGNLKDIRLVVAVDTAYGKNAEVVYAVAVVVSYPDIVEVERSFQYDPVSFPYVPGLFFYREGPTILKALAKLETKPGVIIVHGHGIAHPRCCGMASQIGMVLNKPTIGCARKLLAGTHRPVGSVKGSCQPIMLRSKEVGVAYRSKENVKPIFISPGHQCTLEQARELVVTNLRGFRLPEPLRLAHLFANKLRRRIENQRNQSDVSNETI